MDIGLPSGFTTEDATVVLKYLTGESLSPQERVRMLGAFDSLHSARVADSTGTRTFTAVYRELVDRQHCDEFVEELYRPEGPRSATSRRGAISRAILETLRSRGWLPEGLPESRLLAAYCLYWWSAFARGSIFEVEVFRDLRDSGIQFRPHDLRRREERFSAADLVIMGFMGDVKLPTYFLDAARTRSLSLDFYITQLRAGTRHRRWVVFLQPTMWARIDGPIRECSLADLPSG